MEFKRKILFQTVGVTFIAIAVVSQIFAMQSFISARECQKLLDGYEEVMNNPSRSYPETWRNMTLQIADRITVLVEQTKTFMVLTVVFVLLGVALIASPTIFPVLMLLLLIMNPIVAAQTSSRWYATVFLLQPRNSMAVTGTIHVYDNTLNEDNVNAFVCFRLMVERDYYDTAKKIWCRECVECGYFENQSGFWIFGASYILGKGYAVNDFKQFDGSNAHGNLYAKYSIIVMENKATAYLETEGTNICFLPTEPSGGSHRLIEAEMTLQGDNLYRLGSESNDPKNTLTGHYDELKFYDNDVWKCWESIKIYEDAPYRVQMCSTDEFRTYREASAARGGGGYWAMSDVRD